MDQARQHVATDRIGAQQKARISARVPRRRRQCEFAILLVRRVRRDDVGKDREKNEQDDERQPDERAAALGVRVPEFTQRAWRRRLTERCRESDLRHGGSSD